MITMVPHIGHRSPGSENSGVEEDHGPLAAGGGAVSPVRGEDRALHGAAADGLDPVRRDTEGLEASGKEAAEIDMVALEPAGLVQIEAAKGVGDLGADFIA